MSTGTPARPGREFTAFEPLLLFSLAVAALYFAREILIPFALALTLNFLLTPAVLLLERIHFRRIPAVMLVLVAAGGILGGVGWIVTTQLIGVINDLPNYRDNIHDKIASIHAPAHGPLGHTIDSIKQIGEAVSGGPPDATSEAEEARSAHLSRRAREVLREKQAEHPNPTPVTVIQPPETERQYLRELVLPILRPLGTLGMVVIFTIYMLIKREDLRNRLLLLAGMGKMNLMSQALNDAAERISRYLGMNVLVNTGFGFICGVGLNLLHVPNATLWGALLGLLRMVPYVGTLLGGLGTIAFCLAVFGGWWHALYVLLLLSSLEIVLGNFLEPWLYGSHTGISALALIISALFWTLLWGWWGLLLSTPMTVCVIVFGRYVPQMSFLHILLGEEAELSPEAAFYERLLAMDQTEAHEIADRFLEGKNLVSLYDTVVLPALSLAEQDRHKGILEEARASFLFQSATELVAELADYEAPPSPEPSVEAAPDTASGISVEATADQRVATDSEGTPGRRCPVICIPAADEADEIAATMIAQLLEHCGHKTMLMPPQALTEEILSRLGDGAQTILCISALPPFAFAHARNLAARLREALPRTHMMIGLWGAQGNADALRQRFGHTRPDWVVTTLQQALERVSSCEAEQNGIEMLKLPALALQR